MKTWEWRITWVLVILGILVWLAVQASQPCTLSFKVHRGMNFNQPYPTYKNEVAGEQCVQATDIYGNPLK